MKEEYRKYLLEYYHEGQTWMADILASSPEDAQLRAKQIYYAKVLGTVEAEIPAELGSLVKAACWFRNLLSRS